MNNLINFFEKFKNHKDCENFLIKLRFEKGMHCAKCGHRGKIYKLNTKSSYQMFKCSRCLKRFSVITGTIFEKSNVNLQKWFLAYHLWTTTSKGISSLQLSKQLNVTQKTAWFMLHRLRELVKQDFKMFSGSVEVDETYVGSKEGNKHFDKKGTIKKEIVAGMVDRETKKIKAHHVPDTRAKTLQRYIYRNIYFYSNVYTDDNRSYMGLRGYNHEVVQHSKQEWREGDCYTNTIENFWSIFKRGYMGVYHYMSPKQKYINEYVFRYNNRENKDIADLANLCIRKRMSYKELING